HTFADLYHKRRSRPCFDYEVGLCPGTCVGAISRAEYVKNIRNLTLFFEGKKTQVIKNLQKEMARASNNLEFEKAAKIRGQLFALRHIQDVALISEPELAVSGVKYHVSRRIEGYDISNISGTSAVGSMVVFTNGKPDTNEYRKFKIRTITQSDDTGMFQEVLRRRLRNPWPLPNIFLIDGGKGQINAVKRVLNEFGLKIPVIGIAKGPERKRNDVIGIIPKGIERKTLIHVRDEAHRFAIQYHRALRRKTFL
ncbi:MAG: UvrB/UvrC motif-containing protein, partial [Patescibacteria group bacterium]